MLTDLLHVHNYRVSHRRTLLLETAIAIAVTENTNQFNGLSSRRVHYFVFFAIHNTDFSEETVDGRRTTHGTIAAVYEKANAPGERIALNLKLTGSQNLSIFPDHVTSGYVVNNNLHQARENMNLRNVPQVLRNRMN